MCLTTSRGSRVAKPRDLPLITVDANAIAGLEGACDAVDIHHARDTELPGNHRGVTERAAELRDHACRDAEAR